jgi:predicted outer membrane repeat protein
MLAKNSAYGGGAIYNNGNSGTATLQMTTGVLSGNSVILDGGGIYNDHGNVTLTSCTVSGNSASGNGGGGIYNLGDSLGTAILEISGSTLSGNSSQFNGGAIYSIGDIGMANVQIVNSTVSGNSAVNFGGGVYNHGTFGNAAAQIANSTFSDNSAQSSGDSIYNFDQLGMGDAIASFGNTIFKASASGNFFNNGGTMTSLGYNLSSDNGGGYLNGPGDQINTDPMLGPLQDNGGSTMTHALLPGNPAIDTGDSNFTPPPLYDQRGPGYPRMVNGRIDKGSFEVQSAGTPTPTPTATPRHTPTPRPRPTPAPRPVA